MKKLLILLIIPFLSFGQDLTYVPDNEFEQALINLGYDDILDDAVLTENIIEVEWLNLDYYGGIVNGKITNLTGIEDFVSLEYLNVKSHDLISLNISQNINLTTLIVDGNMEMTALDVSQNINLEELSCWLVPLTMLDLSQNYQLQVLNISETELTSIDLSQNLQLLELNTELSYQLSTLDVSQNTNLTYLNCRENNLSELNVCGNTNLIYLNCNWNPLESLDLSNQTYWQELYVAVTTLDCINVYNWAWLSDQIMVPGQNTYNIWPIYYDCPPGICSTSSIEETATNKEPMKTTDILGRETSNNKDLQLHIYDDGSVEKRYIIE